MKKYKYDLARTLTIFTGIIFSTQFLVDASGIAQRKAGFEYTTHACLVAFICALAYSFVLIVLNAKNRKET